LEAGERRLFFGGLTVTSASDGEAELLEDGEERAGGMRISIGVDLPGKVTSELECGSVGDLEPVGSGRGERQGALHRPYVRL
jgi:hypothetical protein